MDKHSIALDTEPRPHVTPPWSTPPPLRTAPVGATRPLDAILNTPAAGFLADWEGAQQVFYNVSTECGQTGQFAEQSRALIEWSILYKYQGEYERAQSLIAQPDDRISSVPSANTNSRCASGRPSLAIQIAHSVGHRSSSVPIGS